MLRDLRRPLMLAIPMLLALPAEACRCAERTLDEYFAAADEVVIAQLLSVDDHAGGAHASWRLQTLAGHHKPFGNAPRGPTLRYRTARSSAACGVAPDLGATYLLFAHRVGQADDELLIDSCGGTRALISASGQIGAGFGAVPVDAVPRELNRLAGAAVLERVAASHPDPDEAANERLVGLVNVTALTQGRPVELLAESSLSAERVARITSWRELAIRESGYEQLAAEAYARDRGWFKLRTSDGRFGWIPPRDVGSYFPYAELPVDRLSYLTANWSGLVWPEPGAGIPFRYAPGEDERLRAEYPVEVHESRRQGGMLWFRVTLQGESPCTTDPGEGRGTGWVPAYGVGGEPVAWYASRGC